MFPLEANPVTVLSLTRARAEQERRVRRARRRSVLRRRRESRVAQAPRD